MGGGRTQAKKRRETQLFNYRTSTSDKRSQAVACVIDGVVQPSSVPKQMTTKRTTRKVLITTVAKLALSHCGHCDRSHHEEQKMHEQTQRLEAFTMLERAKLIDHIMKSEMHKNA